MKQTKKLYQILYLIAFVCLGLGSYSTAEADNLPFRNNIGTMLSGNSNQVNVDSTDGIPTPPQKYLDAAKDLNDFRKKEQNDSPRVQPRADIVHRDYTDRTDVKNTVTFAVTFISVFNKRDIELSSNGEVATVHTVRGFLQAIFDTQHDTAKSSSNPADAGITQPGSSNGFKSNIHKIIVTQDLDFGLVMANGNSSSGLQSSNQQDWKQMTGQEQSDWKQMTDQEQNFPFQDRYAMDKSTCNYFGLTIRTNSGDQYKYVSAFHDKLVIDGQNHNINLADLDIALSAAHIMSIADKTKKTNPDYQEDWQIKNANLFEVNFYGVVSANQNSNGDTLHAANIEQGHAGQKDKGYSYARLTYGPNINFTGAQATWSSVDSDCLQIDIEGKVTAKSVPYYKYNNYIYKTQQYGNPGDQQIFQCYRVLFKTGCQFTGYSVNANCIETSGPPVNVNGVSEPSRVTLQDGAQVELHPHGFNAEHMENPTSNAGISMQARNSELVLNGSAKLNIICDDAPVETKGILNGNGKATDTYLDSCSASKNDSPPKINENRTQIAPDDHLAIHHYPESSKDNTSDTDPKLRACGAWYMGSDSKIQFKANLDGDSPQFNTETTAPMQNKNNLIYLDSGIADLNHGTFSVKGSGLGSYTGSLMKIGKATINVAKGGDFQISGDGSNRITLLEAGSSFGVSINNPKKVSLDLRKNTQRVGQGNSDTFFNGKSTNSGKASNIVTTSSTSTGKGAPIIDARDISLQAEGDSTTSPTNGGKGKYPDKGLGNLVDLGMKPSGQEYPEGVETTKKSPYGTTPKKVQRVQLPFFRDLIYASNLADGTNKIYLYSNQINNDAKDFANVMQEMGGREFDYVKFSGLNTSQLTRFPLGITPGFKEINGQVTTVKNNDSSTNDTDDIDPNPPKIRLVLTGVTDEATKKTFNIDLGTMFNKKAGFWGYYDKNHNNSATEVEVTPDLIKADGSLDEKHAGKEITSSTDSDPTNPRPRYLDDDTEKKAGDKGDSNSVVTWHDKNNFTINLSQAFKKYNAYAEDYNKNHESEKLPKLDYPDVPDNPNDPKMTEAQKQQWKKFKDALKNATFSLSTVTNFQESRATDIKVAPFYFNIDDNRSDNPDHVYLLGQTILLPIYYIDGNEGVTGLHFQGSIVDQDNNPVSVDDKELTDVKFPEIPFNDKLRNKELFKKVPLGTGLTQPKKLKDGSETNYTVKIKGNDKISYWPTDRNKTVDYQYKLVPLPYFQAQSIIKDKTKKKLKFDGEPQYPNFKPTKDDKDYYYTVETRFEALADQPVASIKFDHLSSDSNVTNVIDSEHPVTVNMKSSAVDKTITLNVNNSSSLSSDTLTPADFGLDSTNFPKATTFTFTHYFKFNSTAPYTTFQLGSDRMINESLNYPDQILGKSEALKGYIAGADSGTGDTQDTKALKLQVPTEITFGDYLAFSKAAHSDGYRYSKNGKVVDGQALKITNENSKSIQASLNAQLVGLPIFHIEEIKDKTTGLSKKIKEYFGYQMAFPIKDDNGDDNYEPINMEPSIVYSGNIPGGQPLDLTDKVANNFYFRTLKNDPLYLSAAEAKHWSYLFGTKEGTENEKLFINWTLVSSLNN